MSIFRARYAGTCSKCKKAISSGQYISWVRGKRGTTYHADCAAPDAIPEEPMRSKRDDELEELRAKIDALTSGLTPTIDAIESIAPPHARVMEVREVIPEAITVKVLDTRTGIAVGSDGVAHVVKPEYIEKPARTKPAPSVTARAMKSCRLTVASHWLEVFGAILDRKSVV